MLVTTPLAALLTGWVLYSPYERALRNEGYFRGGTGVPWTSPDSFDLEIVAARWSLPANALSREGLGGSITWAIHVSFCEQITPSFRGETFMFGVVSFMDCGALRAALAGAFATWSDNHPDISFYDATDDCSHLHTVAELRQCVKVAIVLEDFTGHATLEDAAAAVELDVSNVDRMPRTTAGRILVGGIGVRSALMSFSKRHCWYLDSTFCSSFHGAMAGGFEIHTWIRCGLMVVFAGCAMYIIALVLNAIAAIYDVKGGAYGLLSNAMRACYVKCLLGSPTHIEAEAARQDQRTSRSVRCGGVLPYLTSIHTCHVLCALFGLIFCPVFYLDVFLPCVECESFAATAAHEAGHLLGFHHPDSLNRMNLFATSDPPEDCTTPMQSVALYEQPSNGGVARVGHVPSIMHSLTMHRPETCLTEDDFQGLRFLYPRCNETQITTRRLSCARPVRVVGYLRLMTALAIPYGGVTAAVISMLAIVRIAQANQVKRLREQRGRERNRNKWLRASLQGAREARERHALRKRHSMGISNKARQQMARCTHRYVAGKAVTNIWGTMRLAGGDTHRSNPSSLPPRPKNRSPTRNATPSPTSTNAQKRHETQSSKHKKLINTSTASTASDVCGLCTSTDIKSTREGRIRTDAPRMATSEKPQLQPRARRPTPPAPVRPTRV